MTTYTGRLVCDGYGNLLASGGDHDGEPVAYDKDNDSFVFVEAGEPSHNDRHHQQFAAVESTTDETAGSAESPTEGQAHHWGVVEDDPHYDPSTDNKTRLRFHPDKVAPKVTGHTEARGA